MEDLVVASLTVVDRKGNAKIVLDGHGEDIPSITIAGRGRSTLQLWVSEGNPQILLAREDGKQGALLGVAGKSAKLILYDRDGLPAVRIQFHADDAETSISILKQGQEKWNVSGEGLDHQ